MRRRLLCAFLLCGACAAPDRPPVDPPAPAATESAVDWTSAVEAEAAALAQRHRGSTVRIVVLDATGTTVLASHGDIEQPTPTGSTMKPLTVLAALAAGLDAGATIDASKPLEVGQEAIHDAGEGAVLTLAEAIARSSNVAVAQVVRRVGWQSVYPKVAAMVPLPDASGMTERDAIGQLDGFVTTVPLRALTRAYASMAVQPHGPEVLEMIRLAVGPGGTGTQAAADGLDVIGKTGTARQDGVQDAIFIGRVEGGETTAWIGVSVHDVAQDAYGGTVAAPAFAHIAQAALGDR